MSFKCYSKDSIGVTKKQNGPEIHGRESEKSKAQMDLDYICNHCRNTKLRFLILLPDSDYRKWFYSYKDLLWYRRGMFPGKLILERFEDIEDLPYVIDGPVMPRQVYIMLPKEKIYVPSDQFTEKYIRSKMRELVQIFVALRAKSIKYTRYDSVEEGSKLVADIGSNVPKLFETTGIQVEHTESKKKGTQYEIQLIPVQKPIDTVIFQDHQEFYYLRREPSWRDMILRRVDGHVVLDKYTYFNREINLFTSNLSQKLQWFQLNIEYDWSKYQDFHMDYEIVY
jgi:hypothetical protein